MTTARLAIFLNAELAEAIRAAAEGGTVSGWLANAAERKLRSQALREVVDDWQSEHGAFSPAERRRARRELKLDE